MPTSVCKIGSLHINLLFLSFCYDEGQPNCQHMQAWYRACWSFVYVAWHDCEDSHMHRALRHAEIRLAIHDGIEPCVFSAGRHSMTLCVVQGSCSPRWSYKPCKGCRSCPPTTINRRHLPVGQQGSAVQPWRGVQQPDAAHHC